MLCIPPGQTVGQSKSSHPSHLEEVERYVEENKKWYNPRSKYKRKERKAHA
jgi:hypothetical protein